METMKKIRLQAEPNSEVSAEIMEQICSVFCTRISKRCPAKFVSEGEELTVRFVADSSVGKQGYRIAGNGNEITVTGDGHQGLLAGAGKFLRTSQYSKEGIVPSDWRGVSTPDSYLRGIQMDTHFCNFYHMASREELAEYVEDLALWGVNYFDVVFPLIDLNGWDDPEIEHITGQIGAIWTAAKALGLKIGLEIVPNQDFVIRREEFKAEPNQEPVRRRGNNGHNMCPNKPGALDYITETYGRVLRHLKDHGVCMDFLCFWPYDEGGCGCEKCAPWGANGYLKAARAILDKVREDLPDMEVILSTWLFDTPGVQGEWAGLSAALAEKNDWVNYIMADSHTDFPQYPLTHETPGGLPLINYPEISMWALFPWGGYGANPLPERFERLWGQVKEHVRGGIAYSEGIFDDVNKVVVSQFYWDKDTTADATLKEYIAYEMAGWACEDVREVIRIVENNHVKTAVGNERAITRDSNTLAVTEDVVADARSALALMEKVAGMLPELAATGWRWRILYIRVALDVLRFSRALEQREHLTEQSSWIDVLRGSPEAKALIEELVQIYHSNMDYDDEIHPMYRCVRPALKEI